MIYCYELFSYLIYHLIMILSGRRGLDCWYCWHCWFAMILLYSHWLWLIVWDCPVGTVPFVYMVTGEFPYTWPLGLSRRLCVAVAFWDALWFLLLGVSSLCYVWMQIRARDWWTDRASMEGEDVYMWARCSRMFEDSICCILFSILLCVDVWYNLYDFYFCFELGVPHLYSFSNKMMFFSICLLKHTHKHAMNW